MAQIVAKMIFFYSNVIGYPLKHACSTFFSFVISLKLNIFMRYKNKILKSITMSFCEKEVAKKLFKERPFYNTSINKPYIKGLNNMDLLHGPPFYNELNIVETSKAFRGYRRSYKIEIIESKDPSVQLTISKSCIVGFFKDLVDEIKGFKYQLILKVLLAKYKEYGDWEFTTIYFNSTNKTVIDSKYDLVKSFQEVFNRFDIWITEESGWIIESIDGEYVNIQTMTINAFFGVILDI